MNIKLTKSDTQNLHLPSFRWLQNLQFSSNKWICFHALEHCVWMIVHIIAQHCCYSPQPKIYAQFFFASYIQINENICVSTNQKQQFNGVQCTYRISGTEIFPFLWLHSFEFYFLLPLLFYSINFHDGFLVNLNASKVNYEGPPEVPGVTKYIECRILTT